MLHKANPALLLLAVTGALLTGDAGDALAQERDLASAGIAALDDGDFEAARELLDEAVRRDPDDPLLHYALGVAAVELGRDIEAARAMRRAEQLDPGLPGLQADLGLVVYRLGDVEGAELHLLEALLQGPDDPDVLLHLGYIDLARGDTARAERLFEEAALVDPRITSLVYYEAAIAAIETGEQPLAEALLERTIAADGPTTIRDAATAELALLRPPPQRRLALSAGAGVEYDDNLTVTEQDFTTGVGDTAAVLDLGVDVYPYRTPDLEIGLGYDFFQSIYRRVRGLDLQSHSPHVVARGARGRLSGLAGYRFNRDNLGGGGFLTNHRIDVGADFLAQPWLEASLGGRFEQLRFDETPRRDAGRRMGIFGLRLIVPGRGASLGVSYRPTWQNARGPEFDYRAHIVATRIGFQIPLGPRVLDVGASHDWESRDYDNVTPEIGVLRRDRRHVVGTGVAMQLIGQSEATLDYLHISSRSNLPALNYGENIITFRVGVFY